MQKRVKKLEKLKTSKQTNKQNSPKDIVREIFGKPKGTAYKVSALFTHFKHLPKVIPSTAARISSPLKPLPAAIDIGASSIKLLQLAEGPKAEIEIIALDREKYPFPLQHNPIVYQREALKRIVERNRIGQNVVTGLAAKDVQVYNLTFPPMSETELDEAVRWKIIQLKPFGLNIEDVKYSFLKGDSHLAGATKSTQQRVLVTCASREVIKERVSLLEEVGLKPVAIEVAPISLMNLSRFQRTASIKDEVVIWLDLGADESSLVIERGGFVYFLKKLALTSQYITRQIAGHCRMDEKEAEDAKQKWGLSHWSPDKKMPVFLETGKLSQKGEDGPAAIFYGIVSSLETFVVDIEHSFKYFSYQVSQSQITKFDRVILSGGGSNLKNIDSFLSARLGVPVEKANPIGLFKLSDHVRNQRRDLLRASCDFAVSAGLAAAELAEKTRRINLLPEEEKKPMEIFLGSFKEKPAKLGVLALILAIVLIGFEIGRAGLYKNKMDSVTKKVRNAQAQLGRLQSNQLELAEKEGGLLNRKALLKARLELLKEGIRKPEQFSNVLAQVASILPEEIWVTKLVYSDKKLTITGSASNTELVVNLIESLKGSAGFTDAAFNYSQKEPNIKVYKFEVIADVKQ